MFGLKEWKQTKFYQQVREEGKLEVKQKVQQETKLEIAVRLLSMGFSIEQIAQALELKIEVIRQAIENQSGEDS